MKALIVGQAPARSGDGTPFSGRSGDRLCQLMGVDDLEALHQWFDLTNLIMDRLPRRQTGRGDVFHAKQASKRAEHIVANAPAGQTIVACGRQVWSAFGCDLSSPWFSTCTKPNADGELVELRLFPHPSGLSHFWNDRENVQRAGDALKAIAFSALIMRRDALSERSLPLPAPSEKRLRVALARRMRRS